MVLGDLSVDRVMSDVDDMRQKYGDLLLVVGGVLSAGLIPLALLMDYYIFQVL